MLFQSWPPANIRHVCISPIISPVDMHSLQGKRLLMNIVLFFLPVLYM